jgi:hypothetical protein
MHLCKNPFMLFAIEALLRAGIGGNGVNSKKPPHYSAKFVELPFFFKIAKIHQYCVGGCNIH